MKRHDGDHAPSGGIFWLPTILTGFNLFLGFWSIILILEGRILTACWLIIIASICDGLDGKLARLMKNSSEIGIELDSLADVVSFGVAPGVLLYAVSFDRMGLPGILLAALPVLFGAARLARFNMTATTGAKKPSYEGLPIPAQAVALTSFIIFNYALWNGLPLEALLVPLVIVLALLMISRLPYPAMPRFSFHDAMRHPLRLIVILSAIALIALNPPLAFFPLMIVYLLIGIAHGLFGAPEIVEEELDSELQIKP